MKKCGKSCNACPYIKEGKLIKSDKFTWTISQNVNCESRNIIYMIECQKDNCKLRYVGESGKQLKQRLAQHRGYIDNWNLSQAIGEHFNTQGHSRDNLQITIIGKVNNIKFDTFYKDINEMP